MNSFDFYHKNKNISLFLPEIKPHFFPFGEPKFPHELAEGQKFDIMFDYLAISEGISNKESLVQSFRFRDTIDNIYSAKIDKKSWSDFFK